MTRTPWLIAGAVLLLSSCVEPDDPAPGTLVGDSCRLVDGRPAAAETVEAINAAATLATTTDDDGKWQLSVPPGEYDVQLLVGGEEPRLLERTTVESSAVTRVLDLVCRNQG